MAEISSIKYSFSVGQQTLVGAQMLFVAFGALVLVPLLTGLNPNVALFTAGLGTLIFQVITKGKVPIFLASSFAFIAPIQFGVAEFGIPGTMCGLISAGLVYVALSLLIKINGPEIINKYLPPLVTGPVIMVIGLVLAPVAVSMALGTGGDSNASPQLQTLIISMVSLATTVIVSMFGKGMLRLVPILSGIAVGYVLSLVLGQVDFTPVKEAAWIAMPNFVFPEWNAKAVLYILPVAIAPAIEHVGDILAISSVTKHNYVVDPGVHRTMLGDGIATSVAAFLGGPPNTTYSEVTGAVTLTKAFNPAVMTWAAIVAILLAFIGKLGALLQTIPTPVMGGIMILLFGAIAVVGMNSLIKAQVDLLQARNLAVVAVILVFGIGGMVMGTGGFALRGIGLAGVAGVVLNLILPKVESQQE